LLGLDSEAVEDVALLIAFHRGDRANVDAIGGVTTKQDQPSLALLRSPGALAFFGIISYRGYSLGIGRIVFLSAE
jgi:hypothetical protein